MIFKANSTAIHARSVCDFCEQENLSLKPPMDLADWLMNTENEYSYGFRFICPYCMGWIGADVLSMFISLDADYYKIIGIRKSLLNIIDRCDHGTSEFHFVLNEFIENKIISDKILDIINNLFFDLKDEFNGQNDWEGFER